jgi:hypothetical protein
MKTIEVTLMQRFRLEAIINQAPAPRLNQKTETEALWGLADKIQFTQDETDMYVTVVPPNPMAPMGLRQLSDTAASSQKVFPIELEKAEFTQLESILNSHSPSPGDRGWLRPLLDQMKSVR